MSILDIIAGRSPFFRPTMRQRIRTVDQEYAQLASKGGGPFYLNRGCLDRFQRDKNTDPTFEDIAPPRDSIHEDALKVLLNDRQGQIGRDLYYVHAISRGIGGASADLPFDLPYPCRYFWLSSTSATNNTVFLHLQPLGKNYTGNAITVTGNEEWYQLSAAQTVSGPPYFGLIDIGVYVTRVYLDIGQENGSQTILTMACSDKEVKHIGGVYT